MKKSMKATSTRNLLTFLLILLIAAVGSGFYYGLQQVRAFSVEVSHTTADANASDSQVTELQKLKQTLAESETLVNKANQVFSTEASYQSQGLKDIQKYAASAGLTISNTNFETQDTVGANVAGNKSHTFIITLQSPVSYQKLIQFLDAVEGNLPKMQIAGIKLERPAGGNASTVAVGDITIAISTR